MTTTFALLTNFSFMTSQQHVISREAPTLESLSVLSHFPRAGLAQRRLGFTNKAFFNSEKAAFESPLSIEMHFWHHERGVVGLQLYICCIVFCSLDFSVHVYKWEGFSPHEVRFVCLLSFTEVSVGWKEMLVVAGLDVVTYIKWCRNNEVWWMWLS